MTPAKHDEHWYSFLRWALGIALTAILAMQGVMFSQMMSKIDRITNLMMAERDRILQMLDKVCDELSNHKVLLYRHHEVIEALKEKHKAEEKQK